MELNNLYCCPTAFKVGVTPDGKVLRDRTAEVTEGTVLVTGCARKDVAMKISVVVGEHLESLSKFSEERQLAILDLVKRVIERARLGVVFFYEVAWRCASLRNHVKGAHRLQTLGHEVQARGRKATGRAMYQLGARATVAHA